MIINLWKTKTPLRFTLKGVSLEKPVQVLGKLHEIVVLIRFLPAGMDEMNRRTDHVNVNAADHKSEPDHKRSIVITEMLQIKQT